MNLSDLNTNPMKAKRFHKIFESRFGRKISFDNLQVKTAVKMVNKLDETISAMKKQPNFHNAHKDARYTETLMLKEGIDTWLHVKLGIAHKRKLTEGEIESAEAVLAAKDFVDRLQKMLEDIGRIINEDLPPLSDVVRDQMGSETAQVYMDTATNALSAIQSAISQGRGEMDGAARTLAGEEDAIAPGGMEMGGDVDAGMDPDMDGGIDMDGAEQEIEPEGDFDMTDGGIGGEEELGRGMR